MEKIVFNEKLLNNEQENKIYAVRAILFDNNNLLIEKENNRYFLPGGKVQETNATDLKIILAKDYNITLTEDDITPFLEIQSISKDNQGNISNKITYYYSLDKNVHILKHPNKVLEFKNIDDLEDEIIKRSSLKEENQELLSVIYMINSPENIKIRVR